jgi:hypothetical protein
MGRADACWDPDGERHPSQATHRDTPPEDVHASRQVSWLTGRCGCLAFPVLFRHQWHDLTDARRLQLRGQLRHSRPCGGAPDSLLAVDPNVRIDRTTTARHKPNPVAAVNSLVQRFALYVDEMCEPHHAPLRSAGRTSAMPRPFMSAFARGILSGLHNGGP